ncbi:hypothetical protein [Priestia aryabhattai]|uniref:hypothetical protein n=1 Tax=Priestia aryabhattai TaxID=412384 RepID=UPI001FB30FDF|nr:hypothetical protein [Priestia aryabhattai]
MFSLRGDAHKVYLKLKKAAHQNQNAADIDELAEMEEIRQLYLTLESATLRKVYYRMTKEKTAPASSLSLFLPCLGSFFYFRSGCSNFYLKTAAGFGLFLSCCMFLFSFQACFSISVNSRGLLFILKLFKTF